MNDVTVWPGSSTSPPSDPRRGPVWYGLAANRLLREAVAGFPEIRFYLHKEFRDRQIRFYLHTEYVGAILKKMAIFNKENALRITDFSNRHTIFEN